MYVVIACMLTGVQRLVNRQSTPFSACVTMCKQIQFLCILNCFVPVDNYNAVS